VLDREWTRLARHHGRVDELARLRAGEAARDLDRCAARVGERARRIAREAASTLGGHERVLAASAGHQLEVASLRLEARATTVNALDPRRVLERGYSITRHSDGRVLRQAAGAPPGTVLVTELADGRVTSRVEPGMAAPAESPVSPDRNDVTEAAE
jgi:exodeoxyribonuclease VII large subunit